MTVDIIIPCYYSSGIIRPCLESIAQQTVVKDITVLLINDCSPNTICEYKDLQEEFQNKLKIIYYKMSTHSGPAITRQFGLNKATSDWIMFIDDDDELYNNTSLERLLAQADINTTVSVTGQSVHVNYKNNIIRVQDPWIHHHGSIYNRQVLQQNNIHYDYRMIFDEDGAFSRMILYQTPNYNKIKLYEKIYKKKYNPSSLTAQNHLEDSLVSLIGLSTLDLQYCMNGENTNELSMNYITDATVVKNLLYLLAISNKIQLNHKQYHTLLSFIIQFNKLQSTLNYHKLTSDDYQQTINFQNNHFHFENYIYSYSAIQAYDQFYLEWLMAIFIKLKPE